MTTRTNQTSIEADPVASATIDLATAIARLAKKAMTTVVVDSPPPASACSAGSASLISRKLPAARPVTHRDVRPAQSSQASSRSPDAGRG